MANLWLYKPDFWQNHILTNRVTGGLIQFHKLEWWGPAWSGRMGAKVFEQTIYCPENIPGVNISPIGLIEAVLLNPFCSLSSMIWNGGLEAKGSEALCILSSALGILSQALQQNQQNHEFQQQFNLKILKSVQMELLKKTNFNGHQNSLFQETILYQNFRNSFIIKSFIWPFFTFCITFFSFCFQQKSCKA